MARLFETQRYAPMFSSFPLPTLFLFVVLKDVLSADTYKTNISQNGSTTPVTTLIVKRLR